MTDGGYIHGYDAVEQERLAAQGAFFESYLYEARPGRDVIEFTGVRSVLEVGCGVGAQLAILRRRFPHLTLTGVDRSATQIEAARTRLAPDVAAGKVKLEVSEGERLSFADGAFDGAFLMWVLEHTPTPLALLTELRRVVRRRGRLACTEVFNSSIFVRPICPAFESFWSAAAALQIALGGDPDIGSRLGALLTDAGWRDVEMTPSVILLDKRVRDPAARTRFLQYWLDLFLSAAPALLEAGGVDEAQLADMRRELLGLATNEDAVFYATPIQASARA